MSKTIFVSIASFCDSMIYYTVKSAIENAADPYKLHICIIDQSETDKSNNFANAPCRISYIHINPVHSLGVCWARSIAAASYDCEDYFLQIDSHTAFSDGWDEKLLRKYKVIEDKVYNKQFVISTRPHSFRLSEGKTVIENITSKNTILLRPRRNTISIKEPVILYDAIPAPDRRAYRGSQISAAFLFAAGPLLEWIPYDPYMYFHGEEQNYSLRLYCAGWDIWHVCDVPLFHMYKGRRSDEPALHWDSKYDKSRSKQYQYYRERANNRLVKLYNNEVKGVYGVQKQRKISDFLELGGLKLV